MSSVLIHNIESLQRNAKKMYFYARYKKEKKKTSHNFSRIIRNGLKSLSSRIASSYSFMHRDRSPPSTFDQSETENPGAIWRRAPANRSQPHGAYSSIESRRCSPSIYISFSLSHSLPLSSCLPRRVSPFPTG